MKTANTALKNNNGDAIFEREQVLDRWVEYIGELFNDNRPEIDIRNKIDRKEILKSEIISVLKSMRNGKAIGNDKMSKEMIAACEDLGTEKILDLANSVYNSGVCNTYSNERIGFYNNSKGGRSIKL